MCDGPTATQTQLSQEEANFYQTQVDAYNNAYSNFSDISDQLKSMYDPILAKGPNQLGYNDQELNMLNSQAIEGTAGEYKKAGTALEENIASQGGGDSAVNINSGANNQLREQLAQTGAAVSSGERQQILQSDYGQGYQEYLNAEQGEQNLAAGWNPNSFSGSANNAGISANNEANTIAAQQNSIWTSVLGALGGVAGKAAGNLNVGPFG
jgi:hypothetical protein